MSPLIVAYLKRYGSSMAAVALAVALVVGFAAHERQVGALRAALAVEQQRSDSLGLAATAYEVAMHHYAAQAAALELDTLQKNREARIAVEAFRSASGEIAAMRSRLDSAISRGRLSPDTAERAVSEAAAGYEASAERTIASCSASVTALQQALASCQAQGQATARALDASQHTVIALTADTVSLRRQVRLATKIGGGAGRFAEGALAGGSLLALVLLLVHVAR